jgi:hypothetical protein
VAFIPPRPIENFGKLKKMLSIKTVAHRSQRNPIVPRRQPDAFAPRSGISTSSLWRARIAGLVRPDRMEQSRNAGGPIFAARLTLVFFLLD